MQSLFSSALVVLAIFTFSLTSPTPPWTNSLPDGGTVVQGTRGSGPDAFHESTTSPNPSAVVKRTLQIECIRSMGCDSVVAEHMCFAAFTQIMERTTYRTGSGPEHAGTCVGNALGLGCGIFVSGQGCTISGKELRMAYYEIRQFGCTKCGWRRDSESHCQVRVDFVPRCWE